MVTRPRLLRVTTVPISLKLLLNGQLAFLQQQGFEIVAVSAKGQEVSDLKKNSIEHKVVPMTRTISPLRDLLCLWMLIRVIQNFRPDIVHTHTPKAGLLGMMAAWMCKIPVRMHTVAGLPIMESKGVRRFILRTTEWITYCCAHQVYPNSRRLHDFMIKEFRISETSKSKFKVIGKGSSNGIDTQYFSRNLPLETESTDIRKRFDVKPNEIVFCFVGRLVKDKGLIELVEAFREIAAKLTCRLLLVGSFEEELDPLPSEVKTFLHGDSRVILANFQNDVRPWMMASDAFVFPSYREGFPNVVMQAACLEIPIIASDINGCNELIEHSKTGLLVQVKDSIQLRLAMEELATDQAKARAMAKSAREFVITNFRREYVWNELFKEYKYLLGQIKH